jgi:hypothetical protein
MSDNKATDPVDTTQPVDYTLSQKAYELQTNKKFKEAREVYNQLLAIDKDNAFAKENLQLLPAE